MTQIIQQSASHFNKNFSHATVVRNETIHQRSNWLPNSLFAKLKADQHVKADRAMRSLSYSVAMRATMHELINCCDKSGESRVSQERIATRLGCSRRTVIRHMQRFAADNLIAKPKTGWKQTNHTSLLFLQHWKHNKCDNVSHYLTSPEAPQGDGQSGERLREENKRSESLADALPDQEEEIFEDFIPMNEDFVKEQIRKMKESLLRH